MRSAAFARSTSPVVVVYAASIDGVLADIQLIGEAVGCEREARSLVDEMSTDIDALSAAVQELPRPRVFYEIDASVGVYGPADDSFLGVCVDKPLSMPAAGRCEAE